MSPGLCIAERREDCAYPKCECYASLRSSAASEIARTEAVSVADILAEADHIEKNGKAVALFGGENVDEGRCRELCAMYLREFVQTLRMEQRLAALSVQSAERLADAHDEPCYYCGKPCNSLAGNPGEWPVQLPHADDPGRMKAHHMDCVLERLERVRSSVRLLDWLAELEALEAKATPGPWEADGAVDTDGKVTRAIYHRPKRNHIVEVVESPDAGGDDECIHNDADHLFIVALRNAWPQIKVALSAIRLPKEKS